MTPRPVKFLSPKVRLSLIVLCVLALLALLAAACSIPFVFESQTIRYKFGLDKALLRVGQVLGMAAATLLLLQLMFSARLKRLDKIFGLNKLYIFHRANAVLISVLALLHPLFVFAPEDISNIPLEIKYWPEGIGILLLLNIWLLTATGLWRQFLSLSFKRWWLSHRIVTFIAVIMLILHVLYGSESFESGPPKMAAYGVIVLYFLLLGWVKVKPFFYKKKTYRVDTVKKVGRAAYDIGLSPQGIKRISFLPGQFVFLTFNSQNLSPEEHPFSISSSPTMQEHLHVTIRCSGDWTNQINRLQPGDTAVIDGPYGRFSHLACDAKQELILIAGGIGITPLLSMLRYMADVQDTRKVTLIWNNRSRDDIVFGDELAALESRLPGLRIIHVFSRESGEGLTVGRLDHKKLEVLLQGSSRQAAAFICGPPNMMKTIRKILPRLGFKHRWIYSEEFSL